MSLLVQLVLNVNSHDSFNYNIYLFEMEQRFSHYEVQIKATRKLSSMKCIIRDLVVIINMQKTHVKKQELINSCSINSMKCVYITI